MRIVLYGLPCAGKDYLIGHLPFLTHVRGSEWLNARSGGRFRELPEGEKEELRRRFIAHVRESEGDVIVDGHYCFPGGDGYRVAFTGDDGDCYDVFAYLDTPPETVRERIGGSEKNRVYGDLSAEDLRDWRDFEVDSLREECMRRGKEFLLLDDDTDRVALFLGKLVRGEVLTAPEAAAEAADRIAAACGNRRILLSDGDKTLTRNDLTKSVDVPEDLKAKGVFAGDRYTTYQFWIARQSHARLPDIDGRMRAAAGKAEFVPEVLEDLRRVDAFKVVITAGLEALWGYAIKDAGVFDMAVGSEPSARRNLSQMGKMLVARYLREKGFEVIALGDNMVDYYMLLEADRAYVMAHGTRNATLQETVRDGSPFRQPAYNGTPFEGVPEVVSIHEDLGFRRRRGGAPADRRHQERLRRLRQEAEGRPPPPRQPHRRGDTPGPRGRGLRGLRPPPFGGLPGHRDRRRARLRPRPPGREARRPLALRTGGVRGGVPLLHRGEDGDRGGRRHQLGGVHREGRRGRRQVRLRGDPGRQRGPGGLFHGTPAVLHPHLGEQVQGLPRERPAGEQGARHRGQADGAALKRPAPCGASLKPMTPSRVTMPPNYEGLSESIARIIELCGGTSAITGGKLTAYLADFKVDRVTINLFTYVLKSCPAEVRKVVEAEEPGRGSVLDSCASSIAETTGLTRETAESVVHAIAGGVDEYCRRTIKRTRPESTTAAPAAPPVPDVESYRGIFEFGYLPEGAVISRYDGSEASVSVPARVTWDFEVLDVIGIGDRAFKNKAKLVSVTLPKTIARVGSEAFEGCRKLEKVTFDGCTPTIGSFAFSGTALPELDLPRGVTFDGWGQFHESRVRHARLPPDCRKVTPMMFSRCVDLAAVEIPRTVRSVGFSAFEGCYALEKADISGADNVEDDVFANCHSLKEVVVSRTLKWQPPYGLKVRRA